MRTSSATVFWVAVSLVACRGSQEVVIPVRHPFEHDWMILPQPESGLEIGSGWNFPSGLFSNCFQATTFDSTSFSMDRYLVAWKDSTVDSLTAQVAKLLKLDAVVRSTREGSIEFLGMRIRRSLNLVPLTTCVASDNNGVPTIPSITALIGADSLYLRAVTGSKSNYAGSLSTANVGISGTQIQQRNDSTIVRFAGLRWIGVHMEGFTLGPVEDSTERDGTFGTSWIPLSASWGAFQFRALTAGNDSFVVEAQRRVPGAPIVRQALSGSGAFFALGIPSDSEVRGAFITGQLYDRGGGQFRVMLESRRLSSTKWSSTADTSAVSQWIARRQGAQP